VSAHKVNGPKGAGALYIRAGVKIKPLAAGGGQEREVRGGTENVAAIAGFAAAVADHMANPHSVSAKLRDGFLARLEDLGAVRTVNSGPTLSGHAHVRFPGVNAETLLIAFDRLGISAGSGAACSSGAVEPSHVLLACGYSAAEAREGVRFTLGPGTTEAELVEALTRIQASLPGPN
jgi:cysteine desulfurase